jgi:hypothetical protein
MSKDKLIEKIKKINYTYDIFLRSNEISELGNDRTLSGNSQYISYFNHLNDDEKELIDYYSLIQKEVFDEIFEIYLISEKEAKNLVRSYIKKIYVDKFFDDLELKKHEVNFIEKNEKKFIQTTQKTKNKTTKLDFPMTRFNYLIEPTSKTQSGYSKKKISFIDRIKQIVLGQKNKTVSRNTVEKKLNLNISKINEIKEAKVHGIDGKTLDNEPVNLEIDNLLANFGYDENFNKKNKTISETSLTKNIKQLNKSTTNKKSFFRLPFIFKREKNSNVHEKIYRRDTLKTLFKTSDKVINQFNGFKQKHQENLGIINENNKVELKEVYKNFFKEIESDLSHIFQDNFDLGIITLKKMNDRNVHKYFIDYYKPINSLMLRKITEMVNDDKLKDFILNNFYCTNIDSNQKKYKINIKYIDKMLNRSGVKNKVYQFLEEECKKNTTEHLVIN